MTEKETPQTIYLKDYRQPDYFIDQTYLKFELDEEKTLVKSSLTMRRNSDHKTPLILFGEEMELKSVMIDGKILTSTEYTLTKENLIISSIETDKFTLEIENFINPAANKALEGLYKSGTIFCTQNEPEGFRRITYYIDRPDVMSVYTTEIIADKVKYPILLSNGNPIASGDLDNGKHFVTWNDPFPKPSYLYALVAGDLGLVQDSFTTKSERKIDLRIYVDKGNEYQCHYAMESLKNSMKWDEDRFGLEYDLDIYMIVAVDSFNMGAMENKGLNIFNSSCVLADQKSATDDNFSHVEGVIGHEYFHNWTGNRVTCRDWFQLTLKEGLTVFRDQEFSSDLNSRIVQRINNVRCLRLKQFSEDEGPTSHPIKPLSFIEINNFYTMTIYEKGSEVIRMIHTLLTEQGFMNGMKKYFELYDGKAVTTEDFLYAMSVANDNFDFSLFKNWYSTSGTPKVRVEGEYNPDDNTYTLHLMQSGNDVFLIPLGIGLVNANGNDLPLILKNGSTDQPFLERGILLLTKSSESFSFQGVTQKPIASLNRNFSAPINLEMNYTNEELSFLMANDNDEFNRYEASQVLAERIIMNLMENHKTQSEMLIPDEYLESYHKLLIDRNMSDAFKASILEIPALGALHLKQGIIDYQNTYFAREFLLKALALKFEDELLSLYRGVNIQTEFKINAESMGQRALKDRILCLLMRGVKENMEDLCYHQFSEATNMTDEISSLANLINFSPKYKERAIEEFYTKWQSETLVMQKWLSVQANCPSDDTYDRVKILQKNKVYDETVPNLLRHLVGVFSTNSLQFNHPSGRGYQFVADEIIKVDRFNPQIAARIASSFNNFKKLPANLFILMKNELERIINTEGLSKNVYEIISKTLNDA